MFSRCPRSLASVLLFDVAGAGLQTGRVIGASDKNGEHPITARITPMVEQRSRSWLSRFTGARAEMRVLDGGRD